MDIKIQDCYTSNAMIGSELYGKISTMVKYGHLKRHSNVAILTNSEFEREKHNAQLEIIQGYRNKILLDKITADQILLMLDADYEYLEQGNAVINANKLLTT